MIIRENLRPYKHQRLRFEGVLTEITEPCKRNGNTYNLLFVSLYAKNENIHIDHAFIKVTPHEYRQLQRMAGLALYTRYEFTAYIQSYYKTIIVERIPAQSEDFMLTDLNPKKVTELPVSNCKQPTLFVANRMKRIVNAINNQLYDEQQLTRTIHELPNNGSVEKHINQLNEQRQHRLLNKQQIIKKLYHEDNAYTH